MIGYHIGLAGFRGRIIAITLALLISACAGDVLTLAPDTAAGDQLKAAYFVGQWCTNRDLTSSANSNSGQSALVNLSTRNWRFNLSGRWEDSVSGWIFNDFGSWQLRDRNTLILDPQRGEPTVYQATFLGAGQDLQLQDDKGQYLVLSRCS